MPEKETMQPVSAPQVRHLPAEHRYTIELGALAAHLDYILHDEVRIYTRIWVSPEWRGQEFAEALVRTALEDDEREGRRIIPACSYVARFVARHRRFAALQTASSET